MIKSIESLQPAFKAKVERWLEMLKAAGLEVRITETLRTFERQSDLYAQGRSRPGPRVTNAPAGHSNHNFGYALDCYPLVGSKLILNFDRVPEAMQVMVMAASFAAQCGISWGGNWKSFRDLPHFQDSTMPTLTECRKRWPKGWKP